MINDTMSLVLIKHVITSTEVIFSANNGYSISLRSPSNPPGFKFKNHYNTNNGNAIPSPLRIVIIYRSYTVFTTS